MHATVRQMPSINTENMIISSEKYQFEAVWRAHVIPLWHLYDWRSSPHARHFVSANWTLANSMITAQRPVFCTPISPRTENQTQVHLRVHFDPHSSCLLVFTEKCKNYSIPSPHTDTTQNEWRPKWISGRTKIVKLQPKRSMTNWLESNGPNLALSFSHLQIQVSLTHSAVRRFQCVACVRVCVCVHWDNLCVQHWLARRVSYFDSSNWLDSYCILRTERADSSSV